jgi:threonine aldolase
MRQAGVLGAAALYALEHHVDRLADDHFHAQHLADVIRTIPGLQLEPEQVDTNILIFRVDAKFGTAPEFCQRLMDAGLLMLPVTPKTIRAVTHLDLSGSDIRRAGEIVAEVAEQVPRKLDAATLPKAY